MKTVSDKIKKSIISSKTVEYDVPQHTTPCSPPTTIIKFGILYEQKVLCGNCGIQHHLPKDPGGVLSTGALGHWQTDFGPRVRPWTGLWTSSSPSWGQSWSPWRTLTSTITHIQERLCGSPASSEVPAHRWSKNIWDSTLWRGLEEQLDFKRITPSPNAA